jgi:teichuronic acid biosynthesis glycosyltransferase TuaC
MRVLVVTEYYPRASDPVNGIWVHRQTVATHEAGADVRVLALHRPVPPLSALRAGDGAAIAASLHRPRSHELDGVRVDFVSYLSPPRPWSYGSWGAWAAPALARRLSKIRRKFPFQLIHAHYAVPAGDAIRRAFPEVPMLVSIHGHDVYGELAGHRAVRAALAHARLVLANSAGTAERSAAHGARRTRVVHLGADLPRASRQPPVGPTLVTVAHLAARKRHRDVIAALALLAETHPGVRYVIVGDGPEREALRAHAAELGVARKVEFRGALPHEEALAAASSGTLFVMPSVDEAFGVAYVEAMAAGVPAVGCSGEPGPEEIAGGGDGIELVAPRDPVALASKLRQLLDDPERLQTLSRTARETVEREFTWPRCGHETLGAYEDVLAWTPAEPPSTRQPA